jgi:hypothetical protein
MKNSNVVTALAAPAMNGQDDARSALPQLDLAELDAVTGGAYQRYVHKSPKRRGKGAGRSSN